MDLGAFSISLAGFDCEVILLSRHRPAEDARWQHVTWDARTTGDSVSVLDGANALVNLTGRTVDCVKTPDQCDEILRSMNRLFARAISDDGMKGVYFAS